MQSIAHLDPRGQSVNRSESTHGQDLTLHAALSYAGRGWHVFPVHTPLQNHPQGYTCTCEDWRHSADCQRKRPDLFLAQGQHCDHPGKHPYRVKNWRADSTADPEKIRAWWGRSPHMGIAIDCDKSGLLILDADLYKDDSVTSEARAVFERVDRETTTIKAISGGGGSHLFYRLPEGKTWGNATGGLPAGIDIRGAGGYIIMPPSLHWSGRRYEWEADSGPEDVELSDPPAWLAELLDAAAMSKQGRKVRYTAGGSAAAWDGKPTTDPVDLARFGLSDKTLQAIQAPAAKGQRSEADHRVCIALCYAGATDTDILSIFEHYPIGARGKFADRGLDYLQRTVESARAWVDSHPSPERVRKIVAALRLHLRGLDFAELVPLDLQAVNGYRTNETDRIVADAALDILQDLGHTQGRISALELTRRTHKSFHTCTKALTRLSWLLQPTGEAGPREAAEYRIAPDYVRAAVSCVDRDRLHGRGGDTLSRSTQQTATSGQPPQTVQAGPLGLSKTLPAAALRGHDLFVRSLSALTEDDLKARNAARVENGDRPMRMTAELRRRLDAVLSSAGPGVLIVIDALTLAGGAATRGDLGDALHMNRYQVTRRVSKGIALGLLTETGDGRIALAEDWRKTADMAAPHVPTVGTAERREIAAHDSRIRYCTAALKIATDEHTIKQLTRRLERARKAKLEIAKGNGWAPQDVRRAVVMPSARVRFGADIGIATPDRARAGATLEKAATRRFMGSLVKSGFTKVQAAWVALADDFEANTQAPAAMGAGAD